MPERGFAVDHSPDSAYLLIATAIGAGEAVVNMIIQPPQDTLVLGFHADGRLLGAEALERGPYLRQRPSRARKCLRSEPCRPPYHFALRVRPGATMCRMPVPADWYPHRRPDGELWAGSFLIFGDSARSICWAAPWGRHRWTGSWPKRFSRIVDRLSRGPLHSAAARRERASRAHSGNQQ